MPKVIQVIESEIVRGTGKNETDVLRGVTQYHTLDGVLLAERDPIDCFAQERSRLREAVFEAHASLTNSKLSPEERVFNATGILACSVSNSEPRHD
jgi:hypothetical protein